MYDLRPGDPEQIGEFTIVGRLGGGGMGTVYLGESPEGTKVAIKVVHEYLASDSEFRRRFSHEVEAAGKISGTYTAEVITSDTDARLPWMATEFVEGHNLLQAVDADGPLAPERVLELAAGVADALTEIHRAGVIHRDLKPSNILMSAQGPRVIDFGIARAAEASTVTSTGKITGSAAYMSPEQAVGQRVGPATDIFSLGALLYYAATGEPAFGTGPATAMLYRTVHGEVDLTPIGSEPLRNLVAACLEKDPADRPNAKHVAIAARTGQPVTRLPRPTPTAGLQTTRLTPAAGVTTVGGPGSSYDALMDQVALATAARGNPVVQTTQPDQKPVTAASWRSSSLVQAVAGGAVLVALVIGGVVIFTQTNNTKAPAEDVSGSRTETTATPTATAKSGTKKVKPVEAVTPTDLPTSDATTYYRGGGPTANSSVTVSPSETATVSPTKTKDASKPTPTTTDPTDDETDPDTDPTSSAGTTTDSGGSVPSTDTGSDPTTSAGGGGAAEAGE